MIHFIYFNFSSPFLLRPFAFYWEFIEKQKGPGSEPLGFLVGHHNTNYVSFKIYTGEEQDLAKNNDNDDNNK